MTDKRAAAARIRAGGAVVEVSTGLVAPAIAIGPALGATVTLQQRRARGR